MLKDSIFRFFYTLLSMDLNEGYPTNAGENPRDPAVVYQLRKADQ